MRNSRTLILGLVGLGLGLVLWELVEVLLKPELSWLRLGRGLLDLVALGWVGIAMRQIIRGARAREIEQVRTRTWTPEMKQAAKQARDLLWELMREREREQARAHAWDLKLEQTLEQKPNSSTAKKSAIITWLSHFLGERDRLEWTSHFDEVRARWHEQGLSPWNIRYETSRIVLAFLWVRVRYLVQDCIFARYWEKS
jgi:hypothetical protein